MKSRQGEGVPQDIESLLAAERVVVQMPDDIHQRVMARARTAMSAAEPMATVKPWLSPTGFALALGAAVVGTVLWSGGLRWHHVTLASDVDVPPELHAPLPMAPSPPFPDLSTTNSTQAIGHAAPSASHRAASTTVALELSILQPAQSALERGEFAVALNAIEDHLRRFPNGQLAEEREALRVQTLSAMGRKDEARHVALAFVKRFPESVLLPRIDRALHVVP